MIETKRLFIKPLTFDQLIKYLKNDNSLEDELNLNPTSRTISNELKNAIEQTILPNVADSSKNYLFSTLWTIISKEDNRMVGDLCLIDETGENGTIEIGYGTYEEFQCKGYMSEAVGGMIKWLKKQQNINSVIASTNIDNVASYKVLMNNNFEKVGESQDLLKWKLTFNNLIL
jgi:RimJ/RimL family protein N-acetyltransferase